MCGGGGAVGVAPDASAEGFRSDGKTLALQLKVGDEVGRGTAGVVSSLLGSIDGGRYVVKEVPKRDDASEDGALLQEVELHRLVSASCAHIVRYVFAYESPSGGLAVLMEACDMELYDALILSDAWITPVKAFASDGSQLAATRRERLSWSRGVCDAVRHLHDHRVMHRDVNPWNVFLTRATTSNADVAPEERFVARLGDFGLAARLPESSSDNPHDREALLWGMEAAGAVPLDGSALGSLYSAPELGNSEVGYGLKADAFSVGMTLFAIWAASEHNGDEDAMITAVEAVKQRAEQMFESGVSTTESVAVLPRLQQEYDVLHDLISKLVVGRPALRPTMAAACSVASGRCPPGAGDGRSEHFTMLTSAKTHVVAGAAGSALRGLRNSSAAGATNSQKLANTVDQMLPVFQKFDAVGDGKMSKEKMCRILRYLVPELSDEQADKMLGKSGAASVDYEQFLRWLYQS